jgi:hypothetical protein
MFHLAALSGKNSRSALKQFALTKRSATMAWDPKKALIRPSQRHFSIL